MATATSNRPKRTQSALNPNKIFSSASQIQNKDIQSFLALCLSPATWSNTTEEDKHAIISTLPQAYQKFTTDAEGKLLSPLTPEFIANDEFVKRGVARMKRDIGDGYYEATWQTKARKATAERGMGKFDGYLQSTFDAMFVNEEHEQGLSEDEDGDFVMKNTVGKVQIENGKGEDDKMEDEK